MEDNQSEVKRSESGAPIYYHKPAKEFEMVAGDETLIVQIENHISQYVGRPAGAFHEIISDKVHLDVHVVNPTPQRNYYTLVTSGMSQRPMNVPQGAEAYRYAEMMLCLPREWNMNHRDWSDERYYWPIRWLKELARLPHDYNTWLGYYHTVPNGDPPEPFAVNTSLCCAMVYVPVLFPQAFHALEVSEEKTIRFYSMFTLYREESDYKLKVGADALIDRLAAANVTELVDVNRPNVMRGK